jgi:mannose-1-phosphate guanylyltransferase/mannose-6-phosphate isomerase
MGHGTWDMGLKMKLIPTILCGGAGSRLWPVSREMHPKPFMRIDGGLSLLQSTYRRAIGLPGVAEVLTVTNRELYFQIQDEYRKLDDVGRARFYLLETVGRNTAPAIAAAALHASSVHGEEAMLLVLPADHVITDQAAFGSAVAEAVRLAASGKIVTFGIRPTGPETAYGYIEFEGDRVLAFVEKPPLDKARVYAASGRHLWNAGMFCFSAGVMQREMRRHCPDILAGVAECLQRSSSSDNGGEKSLVLDPERFGQLPSVSVDYAVMEKSSEIAVVPCVFGWSDVGSWDALGALAKPDAAGNRVEGEALLHDVSNCYIRSEGRLVGAVGLDNLVVIDTPDALLVASRSRAQDVKNLYAELKASGHDSHKLHRTVHRPWGTYTTLEEGPGFKIKRIEVRPGGSLSLQMHRHRSEHWVVINGTGRVVNGDRQLDIAPNESTFIPACHKHRLSNPGDEQLVIIEVQTGNYLGEDDIVRFDDVYGRTVQS